VLLDLPTQLGADRAARTGDEDSLPGQVPRHLVHVDLDLPSAEQVGDVDVSNVPDAHAAAE
jgi:hypothetical protein